MVAIIIDGRHVLRPDQSHVKLVEETGGISQLTFTVSPDHAAYPELSSPGMRVTAFDMIAKKEIFEGRTFLPEKTMDRSGAVQLMVSCEHVTGYLRDGIINGYWQSGNLLTFIVRSIIEYHNSIVSSDRRIEFGDVKLTAIHTAVEFDYVTTYEAISRLCGLCVGGELEFRVQRRDGVLYLDIQDSFAEYDNDFTIELAKNMISLSRSPDMSDGIINRIIPVSAAGRRRNSRLTLEGYHDTVYLDNEELIEKYGDVFCAPVMYDDIDPDDTSTTKEQKQAELLERGLRDAAALSDVPVCYQSEVVDPDGRIVCGNYYTVINPLLGTNETLRVVRKETDFDDRYHPRITIGTTAPTMTGTASRSFASMQQAITQVRVTANNVMNDATGGLTFMKVAQGDFDTLQKNSDTVYFVSNGSNVDLYLGDKRINRETGGGGSVPLYGSGVVIAKGLTAGTYGYGITEEE